MSSIRMERCERVATKRVDRVIKDIQLLTNCSNVNNYEYTNADVDKMLKVIREDLKLLEFAFRSDSKESREEFKF